MWKLQRRHSGAQRRPGLKQLAMPAFLQEVTCAFLSLGAQHELPDWDVQKC